MRPQKEHEIGEWLSSLRNTCHQSLRSRAGPLGSAMPPAQMHAKATAVHAGHMAEPPGSTRDL